MEKFIPPRTKENQSVETHTPQNVPDNAPLPSERTKHTETKESNPHQPLHKKKV